MHCLNRQIGVVNFEPLRGTFLMLHNSAHALMPQLPGAEALPSPLFVSLLCSARLYCAVRWCSRSRVVQRVSGEEKKSELPLLALTQAHCDGLHKEAFQAMMEGKVGVALERFTEILHALPLVVVDKKAQVQEVQELLAICREYALACRIELLRRETADPVRQAALAAYFAACKLQPMHLVFGLKVALKCMHTVKNFKMAAGE